MWGQSLEFELVLGLQRSTFHAFFLRRPCDNVFLQIAEYIMDGNGFQETMDFTENSQRSWVPSAFRAETGTQKDAPERHLGKKINEKEMKHLIPWRQSLRWACVLWEHLEKWTVDSQKVWKWNWGCYCLQLKQVIQKRRFCPSTELGSRVTINCTVTMMFVLENEISKSVGTVLGNLEANRMDHL